MEKENNHFRYERAIIQVENVVDVLHTLSLEEYEKAMDILLGLLEEERKVRYPEIKNNWLFGSDVLYCVYE